MRPKKYSMIFTGVMLLSISISQSNAQDWTQWRGPERTGVVENEFLSSATSDQRLACRAGPQLLGPIVVGDKVFVTETKDKQSEVIRALNRADGSQLWEAKWDSAMTVPFFAKANGDWIRATPIYDDGKLYILGMCDILVCLNAEDGQEIWRRNFVEETNGKNPSFGAVCSPLIRGDHL